MNKNYTHLFFDLDNTLWDFEKNSFFALQDTFSQLIKNTDLKFNSFFNVYSKNNRMLWEAYRNKNISKKELIKKRFQLTFYELNIEGIDPEYMNDLYLSEMPKQKNLNNGVFETLNYLKSKKYLLFIITNGFKEVQFKKMESSGLIDFFKKIYISEEIKTPKPGYEIFEHAIKSSNAKKSKSLMIGDDWEVDILGANRFGIDSVYFSSYESFEREMELNPYNKKSSVIHIHELNELKEIL